MKQLNGLETTKQQSASYTLTNIKMTSNQTFINKDCEVVL